jgi:hypothetical protein
MQTKNCFDNETLKKIGKGAMIAIGGALLTYLVEHIADFNFGDAAPLVVVVASILINSLREYKKGVDAGCE